jgi:hypothetical protein
MFLSLARLVIIASFPSVSFRFSKFPACSGILVPESNFGKKKVKKKEQEKIGN